MNKVRRVSAREEARRRWGKARVLLGGLNARTRSGTRRLRSRAPGTAAERRVAERVVGRRLGQDELTDAIKLLRAGARLKELEINERIESLLHPDDL